jgi:hypothetical protein
VFGLEGSERALKGKRFVRWNVLCKSVFVCWKGRGSLVLGQGKQTMTSSSAGA